MEARDVLKQARAAKGLTQQGLAALLPVGVDAVRAIERGKDRPSQKTALAMDKALDAGGAIAAAYGFASTSLLDEVAELRGRVEELEQDVVFLLARQKKVVQRAARPPRRRASDTQ